LKPDGTRLYVSETIDMHPWLLTESSGLAARLCRLGLATRGDGELAAADVRRALDRGVNFLNWCGQADGMSRAIAELGPQRSQVVVCVQLEARSASDAEIELARVLKELRTDYVDVVTFYYVEEDTEWDEIVGSGGAMGYLRKARSAGRLRRLGLTSHQRPLAARAAQSGLLDLVMIRYNAAHRGAEQDVFPVTTSAGIAVVAFTGLRWGELLRSTPDDPPGFKVPRPADWYRFVLQSPAVTVALTAPAHGDELEENLAVLDQGPLTSEEYQGLAEHGLRVRKHAGSFP
jgi:predicted aldo/keto reductase-like oxidoreductase